MRVESSWLALATLRNLLPNRIPLNRRSLKAGDGGSEAWVCGYFGLGALPENGSRSNALETLSFELLLSGKVPAMGSKPHRLHRPFTDIQDSRFSTLCQDSEFKPHNIRNRHVMA